MDTAPKKEEPTSTPPPPPPSNERNVMKKMPQTVLKYIKRYIASSRDLHTCLLCRHNVPKRRNLSNPEFLADLKELCIQCINPTLFVNYEPQKEGIKEGDNLPIFCKDCLPLATELMTLVNQLQDVLSNLNKTRMHFLRGVVATFLEAHQNNPAYSSYTEEDILEYWCRGVGVTLNQEDNLFVAKDEIKIEVDGLEEMGEEEVFDGGHVLEVVGNAVVDEFIIIPDQLKKLDLNPFVRLEKLEIGSTKNAIKTTNEIETVQEYPMSPPSPLNLEESPDEEYEPPYHVIRSSERISRRKTVLRRKKKGNLSQMEIEDDDTDEEMKNDSDTDFQNSDQDSTSTDEEDLSDGETAEKKPNIASTVGHEKRKYIRRKPLKPKPIRKPRPENTAARKIRPRATCTVCGKSLFSTMSLKYHMRVHTGEKPHKCLALGCSMAFYKSSNLLSHARLKHTNERKHVCEICGRGFTEKGPLRHHMAYLHSLYDREALECTLCRKKFVLLCHLQVHMKKTHPEGRVDTKVKDNAVAARKKTNKDGYHCRHCFIDFGRCMELKRHVSSNEHKNKILEIRKNKKSEKLASVKRNRKRINNKPNANEEEKKKKIVKPTFTSEDDKTCPECNEEFPTNSLMRKHRNKLHPKEKNLMCEICGFAFNDAGNLKKHLRIMHSDEKKFKCQNCDLEFKHKIQYQVHLTTHTGGFVYKCDYCSGGSNHGIKTLRKHMYSQHPEKYLKEKPFVCIKVCYINFKTDEEYQNHLKLHEDKYKCNICQKWFFSHNSTKRHMLIHKGEKPYKCSYCHKAFNNQENLQEHTFRHTGERKYRCDKCTRGFLRKKEMLKHQEKCDNESFEEDKTRNRRRVVEVKPASVNENSDFNEALPTQAVPVNYEASLPSLETNRSHHNQSLNYPLLVPVAEFNEVHFGSL